MRPAFFGDAVVGSLRDFARAKRDQARQIQFLETVSCGCGAANVVVLA